MLGDIILWIKKMWKQFWCIHAYKPTRSFMIGCSWEVCDKCDKLK